MKEPPARVFLLLACASAHHLCFHLRKIAGIKSLQNLLWNEEGVYAEQLRWERKSLPSGRRDFRRRCRRFHGQDRTLGAAYDRFRNASH